MFPITIYYFSPVIIIYGASEGIIGGSFLLFTFLFLSSIFFRRAWCGFICPAGGLQDICAVPFSKKAKGGKFDWIKYFIWVPWMVSIVYLFSSIGLKKVDPIYQTFHGISVADIGALIVYYAVVTLITVLSFTAGKRAFCHYLCWMAPFMIVGEKISSIFNIPSLHLVAEPDKCISCMSCEKKCSMSLPVNQMVKKGCMEHSECVLCGECVDVCSKKVIRYSFSKPK